GVVIVSFFFFQAEDGIRDYKVTGVQTCALPIRTAFDAHRYSDALPLATKLVELTEEQFGASDRALVNPLCNLGTTQYRLGDYKHAEDSYVRSVKIAADTGGNGDRLLLRPLHGLGATYYVTRQFEDASVTLQRALDLSRNLDGLLNPGQ